MRTSGPHHILTEQLTDSNQRGVGADDVHHISLSHQILLHSGGPATAKYWETFLLCPTLSTSVCGLLGKTRRLHY